MSALAYHAWSVNTNYYEQNKVHIYTVTLLLTSLCQLYGTGTVAKDLVYTCANVYTQDSFPETTNLVLGGE